MTMYLRDQAEGIPITSGLEHDAVLEQQGWKLKESEARRRVWEIVSGRDSSNEEEPT